MMDQMEIISFLVFGPPLILLAVMAVAEVVSRVKQARSEDPAKGNYTLPELQAGRSSYQNEDSHPLV